MNQNKDDGGAAFPVSFEGAAHQDFNEGMSLRDWFAGTASDDDVEGIMLKHSGYGSNGISRQAARYEHADVMLAERRK